MAWVSRLHFRIRSLNLPWLDETFRVALGQACHFSTVERCWHVSSHGRCRDSIGRLTLGTLHPMGYRRVCIFGHFFLVHRVVAITFLGPPTDLSAWQVHHRDGDRQNNRLDNLMYVTHSENVRSSYATNPFRAQSGTALSMPVMWRKAKALHVWNVCSSITAAAKEIGLSRATIAKYCRKGVPMGDYQLKFGPVVEPDCWPGEEWLPMKNPLTGRVITGREVSSFGRIRSSKGLVTRGHKRLSGYFLAVVSQNGHRYNILVHRLVAYAFLGPPPTPQHTQVNHKDLNPGNNCLDNLECVTPAENMRHFYATVGDLQRKTARSIPVLARPYGSKESWIKYSSMREAAGLLGTNTGRISRCARGLAKRAGSHEFRFAETDQPDRLQGEEWRPVDLNGLLQDKISRMA